MQHTIHEHVMKNGARGLVVHVPGTEVCDLDVGFNSGYMFCDLGKYDVPHVMEHLMGSGNELFPTAMLFKTEAEKNGAYRNASTSWKQNNYFYECADFEKERILGLLAAQVSRPVFPEVSFNTEVSNVREELSKNTTKFGGVAANLLGSALFPICVIELPERIRQLESFTREDIVSHYRRTHTTRNMQFFFAGDFPDGGTEFVRLFEKLIGDMPEGTLLAYPKQAPIALDRPLVETHDLKQMYYHFTMTSRGSAENKADVVLSVLSSLLTAGYRSWVYGKARERGLAYHVASGAGSSPLWSEFGFSGYVTRENARELFELMVKETSRLRTGDIPDDDLQAVKTMMLGSMIRRRQTASDVIGWYSSNYMYDNQIYPIEENYKDIQEVTKDDIVRAMVQILAGSGHGMSFVGDVSDEKALEYWRILSRLWEN